jgi:hypothetical protein
MKMPHCDLATVSANKSFKKRTWITENGQKNHAGEDYLRDVLSGGVIKRRQRPGLMSDSRLKTALR